MSDLFVALGLVLVIEGTLYALFPDTMRRMMTMAMMMPGQQLRIAGLVAAALGVVIVYAVRG